MPTPTKWGSEFRVNTVVQGAQNNADVAAFRDGRFAVAWQDDADYTPSWTSANFIVAQSYNADATAYGGASILERSLTGFLSAVTQPEISGLAGNRLALANTWASDSLGFTGNSLFLDFHDSGAAGFTEPAIGDISLAAQSPVSSPTGASNGHDVATMTNGQSATVFSRGSPGGSPTDWGIFAQIHSSAGTLAVAEVNVSVGFGGDQIDPSIAAYSGGGFVVAWTDLVADDGSLNSVIVGRYSATGATLVAPISVTAAGANSASDQLQASVASSANGTFAVAYADFSGSLGDTTSASIGLVIFQSNGVRISTSLVNTSTVGAQTSPAIVGLRDGNYFVAWQDDTTSEGAGGSGASIRGQLMSSGGAKIGSEMLINTFTSGDQVDVSLTELLDGRIVATWTDTSSGTLGESGQGVRAQIIDPRQAGVVWTSADVGALSEQFVGTAFNDTLVGLDGNDLLWGEDGIDSVWGFTGADTLVGGNGGDVAYGGAGNDLIYGGAGIDILIGNEDDDIIFGEADGDVLWGFTGNDQLYGGAGIDYLYGNEGNDILDGGDDIDVFIGGIGTDYMTGGVGNDVFYSGDDADTALGQAGIDWLFGEGGNDVLYGGADGDVIYGGAGTDFIFGEAGGDYIWGEGGADYFDHTAVTSEVDVIMDFDPNSGDAIILRGTGFASGAAALAATFEFGGYTILSTGAGSAVYLFNVPKAALTADDFLIG
jgi:Ca2+-binding RTX toxin-like protein